MEKLQVALEKARQKRGDAPPEAAAGPTPDGLAPARSPQPRARLSTDEAWSQLAPMTLDRRKLFKNRIVTLDASEDAMHFDILRTKLILQMRRHGWTRVAITSPTAACGKTTTVANLAAGFGRQTDMRSILIDLDLRKPKVGALFGYAPEHGVSDVLSGKTPFSRQAVRLGENVALSMARRAVSDPTRYLLSDQTIEVLDQIEKDYAPDIMIFDMPPILISDDTRAFLKNVDCALLVARAEETTAKQIQNCEAEIGEHTNMLGVVLNQCRHVDTEGGYSNKGY